MRNITKEFELKHIVSSVKTYLGRTPDYYVHQQYFSSNRDSAECQAERGRSKLKPVGMQNG